MAKNAIGWVVRGGKIQGTSLIIKGDWRPYQDSIVEYVIEDKSLKMLKKHQTTIGQAKVVHNYGKRSKLRQLGKLSGIMNLK